MMAIKEWTTQYPTNLDTDTQQPTLINNEDNTRVSQMHSLRDAVQELEEKVGSDNLEAGSIRKILNGLGSDGQVIYNNGGSDLGATSSLYWDDVNGRLGVGTSTPDFELEISSAVNAEAALTTYGSNSVIHIRRAGGSEGTPAQVLDAEEIGGIMWGGYTSDDAWDFNQAFVRCWAVGNWTAASTGTQLVFGTCPSGSTTVANRLRITDTGQLSTGGESSPDVDAGGLCLKANSGLTRMMSLKNPNVNHGMTSIVDTDTFARFSWSTNNALIIDTFSGANLGCVIQGTATSPNTGTSSGTGAINMMKSFKKSGTGRGDVADNENIFAIINNTTCHELTKGNGRKYNFAMYGGYTIGGTNKDVYVDSSGLIGVISSSERFKYDIENMQDTSWLYSLRPVNFKYNQDLQSYNDGYLSNISNQYGLIAEEVEPINSDFVSYDADGYVDGVLYSRFVPVLINEIKALKDYASTLEARIETLESQ